MVWKLQLSGVLAAIAAVLSFLAVSGAVPEPYAAFFQSLALFVTAVSALLVALGVITFYNKVKAKLGL